MINESDVLAPNYYQECVEHKVEHVEGCSHLHSRPKPCFDAGWDFTAPFEFICNIVA